MDTALQGDTGASDALRTPGRDLPLLGAGAGRTPGGRGATPQRCTTRCASMVRGQGRGAVKLAPLRPRSGGERAPVKLGALCPRSGRGPPSRAAVHERRSP